MNAKTVELHLIQSFPPACVNRDGNNAPKDCTFGGHRRARISSQCLKRAIRTADSFAEVAGIPVAERSRKYKQKLENIFSEMQRPDPQGDAQRMLDTLLPGKKGKEKKQKDKTEEDDNRTKVLLYFGYDELLQMAKAFLDNPSDAAWKKSKPRTSPDIALFGRMLAESANLNVDAAAQVAHALSTHRLIQETDFWTAVDDIDQRDEEKEDAGAGMLGTAEFNASVFYRYACVSLPVLAKNLENDEEAVRKTVAAFLRASYDAMPTGKINGHAHYTPPVAALVVVREKGMPLNLANAFVTPINDIPKSDSKGYETDSVNAMLYYLGRMTAMMPSGTAHYALAHGLGEAPTASADGVTTVNGGVDALVEWTLERLAA